MQWMASFLERFPELAVFLAIALGYLIGKAGVGGFSLGPVTGSLIAGLALGQIAEVPISSMAKSFLFLLFLFGIGYSVGPQFLQAMKQGGARPIVLSIVVTVTGLLAAWLIATLLRLDPGFAAGMLSGALTQSPALGTATESIGALGLPVEERDRLVAHAAIGDAICYVFGAIGTIWFCSYMAPRLLRCDLPAEAAALEASLGFHRKVPGLESGYMPVVLRAYAVPENAPIIGLTIARAEQRFPEARFYILRLRRGARIIEGEPGLVIQAGDVLAIGGRLSHVVEIVAPRAQEVEDQELLDAPFLTVEVLVTSARFSGATLGELSHQPSARGIHLHGLRRGGQEMPLAPDLLVQRGDVLKLQGPQKAVDAAAAEIGTIVAPATTTDFIVLGLAIFAGGAIGSLLQFQISGIHVAIGTSVGALVAGLLVGHMRVRHPLFGRIPDGAVSLMTALGLAAFVAMTGLHAGPVFVTALMETGPSLLLGGLAVTFIPQLVGLAFGHWVLRMNPILLLGGLSGAMSMTPAMAAIQERAGSPVPVLGYTPAYPIAQILLTMWGSFIVVLMA